MRHFPLQALAGGLPGAVVAALGLAGSGLASGTAIVARVLMIIVGALLCGVAGVVTASAASSTSISRSRDMRQFRAPTARRQGQCSAVVDTLSTG